MKHPVLSIVLNSIAILVLVSLLVGAIFAHQTGRLIKFLSNGFSINLGFDNSLYATDDSFESGDATVSVDGVTAIDLGWASGSVTVQAGEGDQILLSETAGDTLSDDDVMRWKVEGDTLKVRFGKRNGVAIFSVVTPDKDLTLTVPASLAQSLKTVKINTASATVKAEGLAIDGLSVNTASGDVKLADLTVDTLNMNSASGKLYGECLSTQSMDVDTASGAVELLDSSVRGTISFDSASGDFFFSGSLEKLDAETASGDLELKLTAPAYSLDVDSASGDLLVTLPADLPGLEVEMDSASGDLDFSFNVDFRGRDRAIYGDGSMKVEIDTASGDAKFKLQ